MMKLTMLALAATTFAHPLSHIMSHPMLHAHLHARSGQDQPTAGTQNETGDTSPAWHIETARSTGQQAPSSCAVYSINNQDGVGSGTDQYTQYNGDGTTADGWPAKSSWVSFENMFNNYKNDMFASCGQFGQADDSGPEVGDIYNAIQSVASSSLVDHRFILAVIMQESSGCVRAPTTNYGVRNPGLMQDHDGSGTCNDNGDVQNPCPQSEITQMVTDGTSGTPSGDGLAGTLSEAVNYGGGGSAATFYRAARIYNSGSIASDGNLGEGVATHCYASDIANRLTGWVNAAHNCNLDN